MRPSLDERLALMRPQIVRLRADIVCFQEVNGQQIRNQLVHAPRYTRLTAKPPDADPIEVTAERPILHVQIQLPDGQPLHVVNVHLKSKIPTPVPAR